MLTHRSWEQTETTHQRLDTSAPCASAIDRDTVVCAPNAPVGNPMSQDYHRHTTGKTPPAAQDPDVVSRLQRVAESLETVSTSTTKKRKRTKATHKPAMRNGIVGSSGGQRDTVPPCSVELHPSKRTSPTTVSGSGVSTRVRHRVAPQDGIREGNHGGLHACVCQHVVHAKGNAIPVALSPLLSTSNGSCAEMHGRLTRLVAHCPGKRTILGLAFIPCVLPTQIVRSIAPRQGLNV
eukprot:m.1209076 g.1209076  ORF g.1209076 m.1209076 type:complete len:236 (-) comp24590_c2_seq16:2846-3553(-)